MVQQGRVTTHNVRNRQAINYKPPVGGYYKKQLAASATAGDNQAIYYGVRVDDPKLRSAPTVRCVVR